MEWHKLSEGCMGLKEACSALAGWEGGREMPLAGPPRYRWGHFQVCVLMSKTVLGFEASPNLLALNPLTSWIVWHAQCLESTARRALDGAEKVWKPRLDEGKWQRLVIEKWVEKQLLDSWKWRKTSKGLKKNHENLPSCVLLNVWLQWHQASQQVLRDISILQKPELQPRRLA